MTPVLLIEDFSSPAGGSLLGLAAHTSGFALIILLILLAFSLFSWTLIFRKWLLLQQAARKNDAFVRLFRESARLSDVESAADKHRGSPLSGIFSAGYRELNAQIQTLGNRSNPGHPVLTERNIAGIQRALQRASAAELSVLERSMSWLATTGVVTPFIGLLGTVVGIINAFQGIEQGGTTSIQAVAPGISEALIATAAGLFAAIPAVIAYNHFLGRIKNAATEMDDFSMEFLNLVERSFS